MVRVADIVRHLEGFAPKITQESYDNCGLLVGNSSSEVTGILVALDCTEDVIEEAHKKGCNLVIAHHPIIFKGMKRITGTTYIERTVIKAIQKDVSIYAIHTNLDNHQFGVNFKIGQKLGLKNLRILSPKEGSLIKIVVFVPNDFVETVSQAMADQGAGQIGNYDQCSFKSVGLGSFRASNNSQPFVGSQGILHQENETRLEMLCRKENMDQVVSSLKKTHPYEEVAYDLIPLLNQDDYQGAGMIGVLESPVRTLDFLHFIKQEFNCGFLKHTEILSEYVQRIAFCGGSGSFLLSKAKAQGAELFITSDIKYHDFFDADGQILIADIGHFESEQFTVNLIEEILKEKNITFAIHFAETNTNPVKYL